MRQRLSREWRMPPYLSVRQRKRKAFADKELETIVMQKEIAAASSKIHLDMSAFLNSRDGRVLRHELQHLEGIPLDKIDPLQRTGSILTRPPWPQPTSLVALLSQAYQSYDSMDITNQLPSKLFQLTLATSSSKDKLESRGLRDIITPECLHDSPKDSKSTELQKIKNKNPLPFSVESIIGKNNQ